MFFAAHWYNVSVYFETRMIFLHDTQFFHPHSICRKKRQRTWLEVIVPVDRSLWIRILVEVEEVVVAEETEV